MKNKFGKKLLSLVIAIVFCATTFVVTGAQVDKVYATEDDESFDYVTTYYPKWKDGNIDWFWDDEINMDNVQNSNPSVATLIYYEDWDAYCIQSKRVGKTTISFESRESSSDPWESYTVNVTVKKWVNPCKTFKIGKKNYAKKFKNKSYFGTKKKVSGKLNIKAKKGWKIVGIYKWVNKSGKSIKLKNKKKVKLAKYDEIYVEFKKKGSDIYQWVELYRY